MTDLTNLPPGFLAEDNSHQLFVVAILFGVIDTIFICLFIIARYANKTANGYEMYYMPLGYLFCMGNTIISILLVLIGGAGKHGLAVGEKKIVTWSKLAVADEFVYLMAILFPKLSILCLYLRIFTVDLYRKAAYLAGIVVICNSVGGMLMACGLCKPFAYNWDRTIPGGSCADLNAAYRYVSVPNIATDVAILILPLPVIWKLHTNRAQKIGLTITFLTGSFGIVTSILRFVYFFTTNLFADPTFLCITTMTWTVIEPSVYLIAASLPSLRPLIRMSLKDLKQFTSTLRLGQSSKKESTGGQSLKDIPMQGINNLATKTTATGGHSGFKRLDEDGYLETSGDGISSKGLIHTYHTVDVDIENTTG